jgi:hypothetical protein
MSDAIQQAIEALRMTKYCIPAYGFHAEKVTIDEAIAGLQALQSWEPVAVADRGVLNWIDGKQFAREADLYTTPQPVVDEAVFDILKAAQGSCRLGFNDIADKQIEIAIKALLSAGKGE